MILINDAAVVRLRKTMAMALALDEEQVTSTLTYQSLTEWDSSAHVGLMLALEAEYGIQVAPTKVMELVSFAAILAFVSPDQPASLAAPTVDVKRGLNGVHFDHSSITMIDGEHGRLMYRGYAIHDIVQNLSFEETFHLLAFGELPDAQTLNRLHDQLMAARALPASVTATLQAMQGATSMAALQTGVAMAAAFDPDFGDDSVDAVYRQGIRLTAQIPLMIATHTAARRDETAPTPMPVVGHAAYALALLAPVAATSAATVRLFEQDLMIHADHSSNASTFIARVTTSTGAGLHAAVAAAVGAFSGALHGGAVADVMMMLDEIGEVERVADYIVGRLARNQPVPGFGHRVYRTADPRARHLRATAWVLAKRTGQKKYLEILDAVIAAMAERNRFGIDVNVDLYAAVAYRALGFSPDLYAPLFAMGRIAGWVAHIMEQKTNNILIRPLLQYVGPAERPLAARNGGD